MSALNTNSRKMCVNGLNVEKELNGAFTTVEMTRVNAIRILDHIQRFQERIRKHIENSYLDFMPNHTTSAMYIEEGESLLRETEHFLKVICSDAHLALSEASADLTYCVNELHEVLLGLRVSCRILKIDDLFQCVEDANANRDYLIILDLLAKLKYLVFSESISDVDRLLKKCECYGTIKVKYHIQTNILQQNLEQKFDRLVQFSEKTFPSANNVILHVSKDNTHLQDTVMALFQARYNPMKMCDFLLEKCLVPMITKPVSVEYLTDNTEYLHLNISYSLKELGKILRPSYKQVFIDIKILLDCLKNINVNISAERHVFTIIGSHIKERMLNIIVNECLMYAVPETMDDYQASTLIDDVLLFEQELADCYFINPENDTVLSQFANKFDIYFKKRFTTKILENAREIMHKDLQDMVIAAEGNTVEDQAINPFLFPRCMVSKSALELVQLMERIIRQPMDISSSIQSEETSSLLTVIPIILNTYLNEVPKIHGKLLESIPQQAVLFYNNCMFLAHWFAKYAETDIPIYPALVKTLQTAGSCSFKDEVLRQQKLLSQILKEFDISDPHSIGLEPSKSLRQCLRQMDLLKNVWLNVLPDAVYSTTFYNLINNFSQDIINHILSLEDISATVASELSGLIEIILNKAPNLFKEKHEVLHVPFWMKLQQLKIILNASLQEIADQWCDGAGILTANYTPKEIRGLIRALFQNTNRRSKVLSRIV